MKIGDKVKIIKNLHDSTIIKRLFGRIGTIVEICDGNSFSFKVNIEINGYIVKNLHTNELKLIN